MTDELHWHISKEGITSTRLDRGPYRAYFFTVTDGQLVAAADYSANELRAEVRRRASNGEDSSAYAAALNRLERV